MESKNQDLLLFFFFFFFFISLSSSLLHSADATCVPRNNSGMYPIPTSHGATPCSPTPAPPSSTRSSDQVPTPPSKSPLGGKLPNLRATGPHLPGHVEPGFGIPNLKSVMDAGIKAICAKTDNPEVCDHFLVPYIPLDGPIDPVVVLGMHIKACTDYVKKAMDNLAKQMEAAKAKAESMTTSYLEVCKESYVDALDSLDKAQSAMLAKDKATVNVMISAAMTDFDTCEDGFMERPGIISPMADFDEMLLKITSNCLAIAELI